MTQPLLSVQGLGKSWGGVRAVDDVSFAVAPGEMLALIGPNGAGKSTTFDMIGGQRRPDRGSVHLDGRAITGAGPRRLARLGVGRTFQVAEVFASMTLRENVRVARGGRSGTDPCDLLDLVDLADRADEGAGSLAYGDAKRLELALALADAPRLLLMDEPTAGMAGAERAALMELVRRLSRERTMAVLFTEHDMDVVFGTADRILVLDRGRLIAEGDADAIRADPTVASVYLGGC